MKTKFKKNRGVAGLTLFLSVIVTLFILGLLISIFAIMGSELEESAWESTAITITNETPVYINSTGYQLASGYNEPSSFSVTALYNQTDGSLIGSGNYTTSTSGLVTNASASTYTGAKITYTFTYQAETTASGVINNSTASLTGAVDWFDIFIVIVALVVLILLVVIIISSIKGSGLISSKGSA